MTTCSAPIISGEYVSASSKVLSFAQSRSLSARTVALIAEPLVDELKYRKLIDLAVKFGARLLAMKRRDILERYQTWSQISETDAGSFNRGEVTESYWRNKNLYVRRFSRRLEKSLQFTPETTEIACLLSTGSNLLITINEKEHTARFDVIENKGRSGYCLDGLDYDLALSEVFDLLKQIESV
jgi:hypothetical protein